mmetsp:Transcript_28370/g.61765  ORF Transcript_28370/g.61765 Transcript_28370/m.61765 type:complete len:257 (-) Transcript_28370:666-1436(-)
MLDILVLIMMTRLLLLLLLTFHTWCGCHFINASLFGCTLIHRGGSILVTTSSSGSSRLRPDQTAAVLHHHRRRHKSRRSRRHISSTRLSTTITINATSRCHRVAMQTSLKLVVPPLQRRQSILDLMLNSPGIGQDPPNLGHRAGGKRHGCRAKEEGVLIWTDHHPPHHGLSAVMMARMSPNGSAGTAAPAVQPHIPGNGGGGQGNPSLLLAGKLGKVLLSVRADLGRRAGGDALRHLLPLSAVYFQSLEELLVFLA